MPVSLHRVKALGNNRRARRRSALKRWSHARRSLEGRELNQFKGFLYGTNGVSKRNGMIYLFYDVTSRNLFRFEGGGSSYDTQNNTSRFQAEMEAWKQKLIDEHFEVVVKLAKRPFDASRRLSKNHSL